MPETPDAPADDVLAPVSGGQADADQAADTHEAEVIELPVVQQVEDEPDRDAVAAEEAELLARVARGDIARPFTVLYGRYSAVIFRYARRVVHDDGLAEEVVQETFARFWRNAARHDAARGSVRAYLFTIARTTSLDVLKRASSRPHAEMDETTVASDVDEAERVFLKVETQDCLSALPPVQRRTLNLAVIEGLPQAEVAVRTGVPVGTVKSRMYHGLRALRTCMEGKGFHG